MSSPQSIRQRIAQILMDIPPYDEGAVPLEDLCRQSGIDENTVASTVEVLSAILDTFGVLRTIPMSGAGNHPVKAGTPAASLFLRSYAEYIRNGHQILSDWDRPGVGDPSHADKDALIGTRFLYLIEHQRRQMDPGATPLRRVLAAQVLIKAHFKGRGTRYLVLYDNSARQYQLPGGHHRDGDINVRDTAIRELSEELHNYTFDPRRDSIEELKTVEITQISRTFGVNTAYQLTLFHLRSTRTSLSTGPGARWIDEHTLLSETATLNGHTLNMAGLRLADSGIPGGIQGLPPSLPPTQHGLIVDLVKDKPWEIIGVLLGILGIIASIIFDWLT